MNRLSNTVNMQQHGACPYVGKSVLYWSHPLPSPASAGFFSLQAAQFERHNLLFAGSASAIHE
jgi:hypothetical protein